MRIKVLRNLGEGLPDYYERQVVDVSDEVGADLVGRGLAEVLNASPRRTVQAVPTKPAIAGRTVTNKPAAKPGTKTTTAASASDKEK